MRASGPTSKTIHFRVYFTYNLFLAYGPRSKQLIYIEIMVFWGLDGIKKYSETCGHMRVSGPTSHTLQVDEC